MSRFYLRFQSTVLHCVSNITMFKEMSIKENYINVFGAFWMDANAIYLYIRISLVQVYINYIIHAFDTMQSVHKCTDVEKNRLCL